MMRTGSVLRAGLIAHGVRLGNRRALFVLLAALAFLCWLAAPKNSSAPNASMQTATAARKANISSPTPTADPTTQPGAPASASSPTVAGAATNKPSPEPQPAVPATAACKSLTLGIARQVLGASAAFVTSSGSADSRTADVEVTNCSYAAGGDTITLVAHVALTQLGSSENGVVFGSDKPSGATDVQGLGQAAYWDPNAAQLNVLSDNNWYVIGRARGTPPTPASLSDVEGVARLVTFGG